MNIIKVLGNCGIWLLVLPLCIGIFPASIIRKKQKSLTMIYLSGWLVMIAFFQVVGFAFVYMQRSLTDLSFVYMISMDVLGFAGLVFIMFDVVRKGFSDYLELPKIKKMPLKDILTWSVFGLTIIGQMCLAFFIQTPNGDDAYYIGVANIADQMDKMYNINPYTGWSQPLDYRHALSLFPIFYSFLARQCDIHVAIVAHTIMPPVLILITYLIYYQIGKALFENDNSKNSVFMVLISGLQIFGASSELSNEVFFLTRTWQGKSILANIAIPAAFCLFLKLARFGKNRERTKVVCFEFAGYFGLLMLVNILGGFASGLGLLLLMIYEGLVLLIISIRNKSAWFIAGGFVCMIPCFIFMYIYVFVK